MSRIDEAIKVEVPRHVAYERWARFESFPLFMEGVEEVEKVGDSAYRWDAEIGGVRRTWTADVTQEIPPERIAWTTMSGETVHQGAVHFTDLGEDRCEVRVQMQVNPQGFLENVGDALGFIRRRVQNDLERFKQMCEDPASVSGGNR